MASTLINVTTPDGALLAFTKTDVHTEEASHATVWHGIAPGRSELYVAETNGVVRATACHWRNLSLLTLGTLGETLFAVAATMVVGPTLAWLVRFRSSLGQIGLMTAAALVAAVAFKVHRIDFERIFLSGARLARFGRPPRAADPLRPGTPA